MPLLLLCLLIWYNTLAMWADNPLFGTGTGRWLANYMHLQADFFALHSSSSWGMLVAFLMFAFFSYPLDVFPLTLAFVAVVGMIRSRPLWSFRLLPCVKYDLAGAGLIILLSVSLWS